jgi:hypothetical protein
MPLLTELDLGSTKMSLRRWLRILDVLPKCLVEIV